MSNNKYQTCAAVETERDALMFYEMNRQSDLHVYLKMQSAREIVAPANYSE